jgi:hypothetical protein
LKEVENRAQQPRYKKEWLKVIGRYLVNGLNSGRALRICNFGGRWHDI